MKIRYKGGRSRYEISLDRKAYYFTPENNKILDIQDQRIVNYIFSLPNRAEFEAVVEPSEIVFNTQNNTVTTGAAQTVEIVKPEIKKSKSKKWRKDAAR